VTSIYSDPAFHQNKLELSYLVIIKDTLQLQPQKEMEQN